MQLPLRHARIQLSQGQVFWHEVGKGAPLVFLHGAFADSSQWLPIMERLSSEYHCFAPDLLGFGESEAQGAHQSIALQVETLGDYLKALRLEQVYLIAHSIGGWVGTSYALKNPDRVQGMILIAPEGVEVEAQKNRWRQEKLLISNPPVVYWFLKAIFPLAKLLNSDQKMAVMLEMRQKLLTSPASCELMFQRRSLEIQEEYLNPHLETLNIPALILQGQLDQEVNIAQSKTFAKLLPKAKLRMTKKAGDNVIEAWPDSLTQEIRRFAPSLSKI